jgi:glycerol-3-phosphate acyltransferase PlsY
MHLALWFLAAYLVGSIPTSYLVGKTFASKDLRELGSKNLGATNVYRVLGLKYAIPVALVDISKGIVPVSVFARYAGSEPWLPITLGGVAVVGHVFSVFVKFRGGKGVATASGAVLALVPKAFLASLVVWVAALMFTGYVSVASMLAALVFPIAAWFVAPNDVYIFGIGLILAAFILFTHRSNIRRLAIGTEHRFGKWRVGGAS